MKSFLIYFISLALAAALAAVTNGFAKSSDDPKEVKISVISPDEAQSLFKTFASNKGIPFKYPIDGCYARATEMALMAEKSGVNLGKVFAEGSLQVKTESTAFPLVQWGWHVAPIAYVKNDKGQKEIDVFDPSLFKKPVPLQEWEDKMKYDTADYKTSISTVYFGDRYQYDPASYEAYKGKWSQSDLDDVKVTFTRYLPLQDLSSTAKTSTGSTPADTGSASAGEN